MAIIVSTFTDPKERARAIGVWGAVFGVSMAIGPLAGSILTEHMGWRSIFWIKSPSASLQLPLRRASSPSLGRRGLEGSTSSGSFYSS
jgi:MFS family permease